MNTELIEVIKKSFSERFNTNNSLLIFSPGRINLIGEHTDYNEGFVFPAAIDKGIYIAIQKTENSKSTMVALDKNEVYEFDLNNIIPLSDHSWKNYVLGVISEIQKKDKKLSNFNVVIAGDIPEGAGLSSSAALENAIAYGLNELFDLNLSKQEMILISQQAEHNFVGVKCGIMDQFASMFGEENSALLLDCRSLEANSYTINLDEYELVLIHSNVKHTLATSAYNDRRAVCEKVASLIGVKALRDTARSDIDAIASQLTDADYQKTLYVIEENERTLKAASSLLTNDIKALGKLLFESHKGLSEKYKVSCSELDFLVNEAQVSKAVIGARMMGGGFGGCTINIVESSKKETFLATIQQKYSNTFNNMCSIYEVNLSKGTRVIL
ncbi:galactokinase [Kordia sp.]|uniref:galactokinase n=1 Tax=Kordia sp. TaxID=1965332 RepID=UPI003D6B90FE